MYLISNDKGSEMTLYAMLAAFTIMLEESTECWTTSTNEYLVLPSETFFNHVVCLTGT
jgi:hypothetical protein